MNNYFMSGKLIDYFGTDIDISDVTYKDFIVRAHISEEDMFKWAVQYAGHSVVLEPAPIIDITTNGLDEDAEIVSFTALRFENGVPTERFLEYVNSGAVLSDSVSEVLSITNDTLQRYGTTLEDAYWQFIEFCYGSDLVSMHHDFDNKFIERICRKYDLPALENHITDLDTMFRMKFNRGYSTRFAEKQLGITSDENDDWRHLDIAGKVFIVLQGE